MDTLAVYIKMCEKAEKIQEILDNKYYTIENVFVVREKRKQCIHEEEKIFIPYFYNKLYCERCGKKLEEYETTYINTYHTKPFTIDKEIQKFIWLPRQDQLQEIAKDIIRINNPVSISFDMYFWIEEFKEYLVMKTGGVLLKLRFVSMEQLWLAFVMKEKYHKIWKGEDWVES